MRGTGAARTGQPIAIDDEDAVGHRIEPVELFQKVAMRNQLTQHLYPSSRPALWSRKAPYRRRPAVSQRRRPAQIGGKFAAEPVDFVDQPADHDDIVEAGGVAECSSGWIGDPGAGRDRRGTVGYHFPIAGDVPAAIAFDRGEAQDVDEIGEGAEREAPGENETHRQTQPAARRRKDASNTDCAMLQPAPSSRDLAPHVVEFVVV